MEAMNNMNAANRALLIGMIMLCPWTSQWHSFAQASGCTDADRKQAEAASDHLTTWHNVYAYYRRYGRCGFDADAAEGISDSIGRLLARNLDTLPTKLLMTNLGFRTFVLAGVNATLESRTLHAIEDMSNARSCPVQLSTFCTELQKRAKAAAAEQQ
jgi:hypothetical protein